MWKSLIRWQTKRFSSVILKDPCRKRSTNPSYILVLAIDSLKMCFPPSSFFCNFRYTTLNMCVFIQQPDFLYLNCLTVSIISSNSVGYVAQKAACGLKTGTFQWCFWQRKLACFTLQLWEGLIKQKMKREACVWCLHNLPRRKHVSCM